jgi:hypothetical protein
MKEHCATTKNRIHAYKNGKTMEECRQEARKTRVIVGGNF